MDDLNNTIKIMGKYYVYVGYSFKHQRHAFINEDTFKLLNCSVDVIAHNLSDFSRFLTYVKKLTDLEC